MVVEKIRSPLFSSDLLILLLVARPALLCLEFNYKRFFPSSREKCSSGLLFMTWRTFIIQLYSYRAIVTISHFITSLLQGS